MTNDRIVECVECQEKDFECFMKKNEAGEAFCPVHFHKDPEPDLCDFLMSCQER